MEALLSNIAGKYEGELCSFQPVPKAAIRQAYEKLDESLKRKIIQAGEEYLGYRYPGIYATDFMDFLRTGNRVNFEAVYFQKRHALMLLVMAECVEHQGRFMDDIVNGIFSLCEESAWQLPAHNSYIRDTPQLLLPDIERPVLDLFACETAEILSMIHYLLEEELDAFSPLIHKRIFHELHTRIISPYLKEHFWWMGKEDESMNNWTVWCTQNVLLTVFLTDCNASVRKEVFKKAALSCDCFLKEYGEDGCCDEGASYYRHAGLCLFHCLTMLDRVSNHAFSSIFTEKKIQNIASYILNVHVDDQYYFNFADCSPIAGRAGVREYLFGKAAGLPDLCYFAARDFQADEDRLSLQDQNQINLFYQMLTLFHYDEIMAQDTSNPVTHRDIYYESVGLFIARNNRFSLAVKAGDNNDSHNHNDTGSFTLYQSGQPLFVDIGVESYTKKTFSPQRYEIWTMQSGYHNLPAINGLDQMDGASCRAEDVSVSMGSHAEISMDLSHAYPLLDESVFYHRTVQFYKEQNKIVLRDETNASDVVLNFITYEKPEVNEHTILIGSIGKAVFEGASLLTVETLPVTDARLKTAWKHDLYRIRLKLTEETFTLSIN